MDLALTISGISKGERRNRAKKALEEVGLGEQIHKRPNQLSGGQMQRVAIARALVNNPDILLADEPTGALDTETSVQVMELLKEVARDRLVVMVTHNPELAQAYATRIVTLRDGKILGDSDPFIVDACAMAPPKHRNMGKASMSLLTALSLSFNNLLTKKARTLLTAFAGSIGIIGIALILSLSNGVNDYIASIEEETLSEYPLQITSSGFDMTSMMTSMKGSVQESLEDKDSEIKVTTILSSMLSGLDSNDLLALKEYLESGESDIQDYVKAIEYLYDVDPQIYLEDGENVRQVNPNTALTSSGVSSLLSMASLMSYSTDVFAMMPQNTELYEDQYDVVAGRWPENYDECVLVLSSTGAMTDFMLYMLGLRDYEELEEMVIQSAEGETITFPQDYGIYSYEDVLGITFKLVSSADYYEYDSEYDVWVDKSDNDEYIKNLVSQGEDLVIVGVVMPSEGAISATLSLGINYTPDLITHIVETAAQSDIVQAQMATPKINVLTGEAFGDDASSMDLSSLFSIDEDALQNAFSMDSLSDSLSLDMELDPDSFSLDMSSLDFSSALDLSGINIDLGDTQLDLSGVMSGLSFDVSADSINQLGASILAGYPIYLASSGGGTSDLTADFCAYLTSDEAKSLLSSWMLEIMENNGSFRVDTNEVESLLEDILTDYENYLAEQDEEGNTVTDFEYLASNRAQEIFDDWAEQSLNVSADLSFEDTDLEQLAQELAAGYTKYATANGLTTTDTITTSFQEYLGSDMAAQIMAAGVLGMMDISGIQEQMATAMQSYMQTIMGTYAQALSAELEAQISAAMAAAMEQLTTQLTKQISQAMEAMMEEFARQISETMEEAFTFDADALADAFQFNMDSDTLTELMTSMTSYGSSSYESNLSSMGYVDFASPTEIDIYPKDFAAKEKVVGILDDYNEQMEKAGEEGKVITYTDVVGTLMSSVTTIIDVISYVLIAFVSVSLIVSSIMIGIITYISVMERTREIGILRAIGASKRNISQIFNAETFIVGFCAGLMGVLVTVLLLIPINLIIHAIAQTDAVNAVLPVPSAVLLVLLSMILTLIGGLIPSGKAAKRDPVTALRSE